MLDPGGTLIVEDVHGRADSCPLQAAVDAFECLGKFGLFAGRDGFHNDGIQIIAVRKKYVVVASSRC
jgi:hypothetical protein